MDNIKNSILSLKENKLISKFVNISSQKDIIFAVGILLIISFLIFPVSPGLLDYL